MPTYRSEDGRAWVHINFGRRKDSPLPCVGPALATDSPMSGWTTCRRISVALCDHPAGRDVDTKVLTCDAPVCDHHRTQVGPNADHCWRHTKGRL